VNQVAWESVLLAVQALIGAGVGIAIRTLRSVQQDTERISQQLVVMNGRLGKTEQKLSDHETHCDDRHDRHRTDILGMRDRMDRVFGATK
jgi:glucose-6-phosphate-specific signal transduction histidine kinase